jgi:hypothetical protein
MSDAITPGRRFVRLLDEGLPRGVEWTASERAVCALIEDSTDLVETLKALLATEVARPEPAAHRCCELAGEIRQAQAAIAKMTASLDPEMVREPKSERHQRAAYSRWHGGPA